MLALQRSGFNAPAKSSGVFSVLWVLTAASVPFSGLWGTSCVFMCLNLSDLGPFSLPLEVSCGYRGEDTIRTCDLKLTDFTQSGLMWFAP